MLGLKLFGETTEWPQSVSEYLFYGFSDYMYYGITT